MNKELILQQEAENDGRSVFLYFDEETRCYFAFGHSAYYADMVTSVPILFSQEMQLPMMKLGWSDVKELRQSMEMVEHTIEKSYHFHTKQIIGNAGYERWLKTTLKK